MHDAVLVGLGNWGRVLVESIHGKSDALRFVAAVTLDADESSTYADSHGIQLYKDLDTALADPTITAVVIASPHSAHAGHIATAVRHGRPTFVEKPLTVCPQEARDVVAQCRAAGVGLLVGFNWRYHPAFIALMDLVESGQLGDILHLEGNYSGPSALNRTPGSWRLDPRENPAGAMTGRGVHVLNLMSALVGNVASVYAFNDNRSGLSKIEDTTSVLMRFTSGATGYVGTCQLSAEYWRLHITGTKAWAEMRSETELVFCSIGGEPVTRRFSPISAERAELEAFAACLSVGIFPERPVEDAVEAVVVLDAIDRSAAQGVPIFTAG
jgi:predicted dehydrogenase